MTNQKAKNARLRHTATGALAALATVGVIAATGALAANPHAKTNRHAAIANGEATKRPASPAPDKTRTPQPAVNHQPFFNAVQQLVNNGAITGAEGQIVDREIQAGKVDTDTLTASGFTRTQLQAVQQALANAKIALAPSTNRTPK